MNYWLLKTDPETYAWETFLEEKKALWDGVRNYAARNNLKLMRKGDVALIYESNQGLWVRGTGKVTKEFFQDPTTTNSNWVAIELVPAKELKHPVTLKTIKQDPVLEGMQLVKNSRLSVMPVSSQEFNHIIALSKNPDKN